MKYVVEISDNEGTSCRVQLDVPWRTQTTTPQNSTWQVLDEGLLKFRSGGCQAHHLEDALYSWGPGPTTLALRRGEDWGVVLYAFTDEDRWVNSSGTGRLVSPWALGMKSGELSWAVVG